MSENNISREEKAFNSWGQIVSNLKDLRSIIQNPLENYDDLEDDLEALRGAYERNMSEIREQWNEIESIILEKLNES